MLWLIDYSPIGIADILKVSNGVNILDFETRHTADFAYPWLNSTGAGRKNLSSDKSHAFGHTVSTKIYAVHVLLAVTSSSENKIKQQILPDCLASSCLHAFRLDRKYWNHSNAYEFSRTAQQNLCRNRYNHFCKKNSCTTCDYFVYNLTCSFADKNKSRKK